MPVMPTALWTYRARATHVVDGDTADVIVDGGFHAWRLERLRLLTADTPERGDAGWAEATSYTRDWLAAAGDGDWPLIIVTEKSDVFGRFLATIYRVSDGRCLNDDLLASGHAVVWSRGGD